MFIVLETSFAVEMFTSFFPPFYQSNSRKLSQRDRCLSEYNEEKKKRNEKATFSDSDFKFAMFLVYCTDSIYGYAIMKETTLVSCLKKCAIKSLLSCVAE